jgi:hypothetical protein
VEDPKAAKGKKPDAKAPAAKGGKAPGGKEAPVPDGTQLTVG